MNTGGSEGVFLVMITIVIIFVNCVYSVNTGGSEGVFPVMTKIKIVLLIAFTQEGVKGCF